MMRRKKRNDRLKDTEELLKEISQLQQKISELESENQSLVQKAVETNKSVEWYQKIMKDTDDLIAAITFTLNPTYTYISPSHKKIMGYDPEDLVGKKSFDFVHPNDRKNLLPILKKYIPVKIKALITGKAPDKSERIEYRAIDKAGQWHYLQSSVNLLKNRDELLLISRDISQQKKAEQERRELEEKLRQSEKLEAIGTLAGGVAHDLNNILSAIINYPELLLMDLPEDSPFRQPVMAIQGAGERAAAIVTDLLTLARRGPMAEEVVCLNDIIRNFLNSPEYEKIKSFHAPVRLHDHLDPQLFNMKGSPVHLGKLLINLVSNAVEAIREEGSVTISTRNQYVDKPVSGYDHDIPKGEYVVLTVEDDGIGMSGEDLKKIFMPFYTKKQLGRSGTGLGMTVVWGTAKDHKGYIKIESKQDKGTTFELYFPAAREEIPREKPEVSIEDYMGKGETIVVVDDVEDQRKIATLLLTPLGYKVKAVVDAREAFQYLGDRCADLFILDMIMDSGPDGLDTYKMILEKYPGAKAIIASGYSETDRVREAQRLGAGEYIRKPYKMETIAKAVKKELTRKKV
jgi:two-component system, cell cycle sensor histidine kinase and response regulator CckA